MVHIESVDAPPIAREGRRVGIRVAIRNPEYPDKRRDIDVNLQTVGSVTGNRGSVVTKYSSPWPGEWLYFTHPMWAEDVRDEIWLWDYRGFEADRTSIVIRLPALPAVVSAILDRDKTVVLKYLRL